MHCENIAVARYATKEAYRATFFCVGTMPHGAADTLLLLAEGNILLLGMFYKLGPK